MATQNSGIQIGEMIQEWEADEGDADPMQAYIQVAASIDGEPITLGTMVGVPDHLQGTARAAGGWVRPYLATWWAHPSDWQDDVPVERLEEVEEALEREAARLWESVEKWREDRA